MGGKNQTSTNTSNQTYTPAAQQQLQSIWNQVQGAASTPYQAYTGQMTAGLDPTQQAGINTINSAQGSAQPDFNQATQYANQAAAPISASQIQNYESPYTQGVINSTQAQFNNQNQQQSQQLSGNAALQGALGGDRVGVAQANLANQQQLAQAPVIAGLNNQNYTQALGAAQQDRAAQGQAAYSLGSLGAAQQNTAIQGGNAQLGAGAVAQGTTQAGLSAAYQQYLQQQAFPYQNAQFLASYGLPAATAQGGTQSGQGSTTQQGSDQTAQYAGLALAAAAFLKDGGRVNTKTVPESKETLVEQQKQLVSGNRHVQMFPHGTKELPLPKGMERTSGKNGIFHYNPQHISAERVKSASSKGRENELLGLGNLSKSDVIRKSSPSATPLSIVERTPHGVEVRATAATSDTVQDQMRQMHLHKGIGNSLSVEHPENTIAMRKGKYASGGSVMGAENFIAVPSYIPQGAIPQAQTPQMSQMQSPKGASQQQGGLPSPSTLTDGLGGLSSLFGSGTGSGGVLDGGAALGGAGGGIGMAARGGRIGRATGGVVTPFSGMQGYDDGGSVGIPLDYNPGIAGFSTGSTPFDARYSAMDARTDSAYQPYTQSAGFPPSQTPFSGPSFNDRFAGDPPPDAAPSNTPAQLASGVPMDVPQSPGFAGQQSPVTGTQAIAPSQASNIATPTQGYAGNMSNYSNATKAIESGGNYQAVGPATKTGDKAYGAYQIMGANIPQWTAEVLGKPMTPAQFVSNPQAQDAVYKAKFGQLVNKYGPEGAARAWFAGEGGMNNSNAKDVNGMSVAQYGNNFMSALNGSQQKDAGAQPQMASNDDGTTTDLSAQSVQPSDDSNSNSKSKFGGFNPLGLSDNVRQSLMAAGLGIAASKSPFALNAIGEGGLQGLNTYSQLTKQDQSQSNKKQEIDLRAKQMAQSASQFAQTFGENQRQHRVQTGYQEGPDGKLQAIPGGPQDPTTIQAQTQAKRISGLTDTAVEIGGRQLAAGDMSPLVNLGRGAQADDKINMLRNKAAEVLVEEKGMSPTEAANYVSQQVQNFKARGIGLGAEARTAGTREANLNIILKSADAAIPAALDASRAVARTGWVPVNQLIQKGQVIASNPELKEFGMANLQLAEHWARAMNPTGVMRESDRDKALEFLSTADSQPTYERAVMQLRKQIGRERDAVASQRQPVPGGAAPTESIGATAVSSPIPQRVRQNGHTFEKQTDGSYKAID